MSAYKVDHIGIAVRSIDEALDVFLAGKYRGAYEDKLVAEFRRYLPSTPPWKRGCC